VIAKVEKLKASDADKALKSAKAKADKDLKKTQTEIHSL